MPDPPADALAAWLATRAAVSWSACTARAPRPRLPHARDGHQRFLDTVARARDPERAARMTAALAIARADARARVPLGVELLARWQGIVLGCTAPAPFRAHPAYAKQGRERYGLGPDTVAQFEQCLRETVDETVPLAARAARAYLDVLFFHPFDDGNGRAAALALDAVLTRSGALLDAVGPLFVLSRWADDAAGAVALVRLLNALLDARPPHDLPAKPLR